MNKTHSNLFMLFFAIFLLPTLIYAYSAASSNYRIEADSINTGGDRSTSANYIIEDTKGEVGTGALTGTDYSAGIGYQQMAENFIAVTALSNITFPTLEPTNYSSEITQDINVATDNAAGYYMTLSAQNLSATETFTNYASHSNFDYDWDSTATTLALFGYTVTGTDAYSGFKDDGSSCSTGSNITTDKCWSSGSNTIANSTSANFPDGITTTVKFKAGIGSAKTMPEETYSLTATVLVYAN